MSNSQEASAQLPRVPEAPNHSTTPQPAIVSQNSTSATMDVIPNGDDEAKHDDNEGDGGDLRDDLEEVFSLDFGFQGNFYHSETHTLAPNPCLTVEGIGQIGLPLAARDAQLLIQASSQAPFGRGTELVVDANVRHTWEIEPGRIQFLNPAWATFVQDAVITSVWKALGVAPAASQTKCELYKLLLYETGSHFLPHQDTEKSPGMFATVVIVLPSLFTGGEVHVSHGSKKEVIDVAANSLLATSVIAWYTDVFHEVKPITSGYRLALSYNLIHTAPGIPQPTIPQESDALHKFRKILRKWQGDRYADVPEEDHISYILKHQYSPSNLRNGLNALKGQDSQLVAHVKKATQELGFHLFLGNLRYTESGPTDDDGGYGYGYHKRQRCYYDEDSDESGNVSDMYMNEVEDTSISVDSIVDVEGDLIQGARLTLSEDSLVPKQPFEDVSPDGKSYEGYQGNYPGNLDQWYSRSVLIIASERGALDVEQTAAVPYLLGKLQKCENLNEPSPENRKAADRVVRSLARKTYNLAPGAIQYMLDLSVRWKDSDMWNSLVNTASNTTASLDLSKLVQSMPIFGFDVVKPHFEKLLLRHSRLQQKFDVLEQLSKVAADGAANGTYIGMTNWCHEMYTSSITTLANIALADIPSLLAIGKVRGASYLHERVLPLLVQNPDFNVVVAFVKSLHEHRSQFPDACATSNSERSRFDSLLDECLNLCLKRCNTTTTQSYYGGYGVRPDPYSAKLECIIKTIEVYHSVDHQDRIPAVFEQILQIEAKPVQVAQFYAPLASRLRTFMTRVNIPLSSSPYNALVKIIVELYLHHVLATPTTRTDMQVRRIGCTCNDCAGVNQFLEDPNRSEQLFRMVQKRRLHVENHLNSAKDLVTYQTIRSGSPHGVQVNKTPTLLAAQRWSDRVRKTRQFLAGIGNNTELAALMGNRFKDVELALCGTRLYILDQAHRTSLSNLTNGQIVAATPHNANLTPGNVAAGQKRKVSGTSAPVTSLGVIDLTDD